ncbi:hypothetical protein BRADI_2g04303v3 [Brachypodium distachyon]|uniref:Uncharacterized protein n=1 Tax=Brachypodium distachyon TaxID=15368 RepID=A0A0Q3JWR0_BRADI|nr:hypothetical protein BRADI_2g04303v3 [Brachypodium distachyon]
MLISGGRRCRPPPPRASSTCLPLTAGRFLPPRRWLSHPAHPLPLTKASTTSGGFVLREIQMAAMGAPRRRGEVRGGVSFDREAAEVAADGEGPRSAEDVDAGARGPRRARRLLHQGEAILPHAAARRGRGCSGCVTEGGASPDLGKISRA